MSLITGTVPVRKDNCNLIREVNGSGDLLGTINMARPN